jgi:LysM repeat protein
MRRKKILWWGLGLGSLILLVILGVLFYLVKQVPPIAEQVPMGYSRVAIAIVNPPGQSIWPANSFIPIQFTAQGTKPIMKVDLFINGSLYESKTEQEWSATTDSSGQWMWQPGNEGGYILVVKASDSAGNMAISEPVLITASAPAQTVSPVVVKEGESLASLAESNNMPLEDVKDANPQVDPNTPLEPGLEIFIPNPPVPVSNTNLIASVPLIFIPLPGPEDGTQPGGLDQPVDKSQPIPSVQKVGFFEDLKFWIKISQLGPAPDEGDPPPTGDELAGPPPAPGLSADFKNCDVKIALHGWYTDSIKGFGWINKEEDGFFVYRSRNGSAFERIATLPPVHKNSDIDAAMNYVDANQWGNLMYYASAFNVLGESASDPAAVPLDQVNCQSNVPQSDNSNQVQMQDGNLILPYNLDMAYLYLQINGGQGMRVPEGNRSFLPGSGMKFNIYDYLNSRIDEIQEPDLALNMEVWGWSGGGLLYAGSFSTMVHRTILTICSVAGEGGCTGGGGGSWVSTISLPPDQPLADLVYEVRWRVTSLSPTDGLYFQLASGEFFGDLYNQVHGLLSAYVIPGKGAEGVYSLPLGVLLYPDPLYPNNELGWGGYQHNFDFTTNGFIGTPPGEAFSLSMRVNPRLEMSGLNLISNQVHMLFNNPPPPSELPPLASTFPSIYDVQILRETYQPPQFLDESRWGCVIIDKDPTNTFAVGSEVCPGKYTPTNDCAGTPEALCLLKGLGNAIGFVYDFFVTAIEVTKGEIVKGIVYLIPTCSESSDCKAMVAKGVDYGITYVTGLPPSLPKSGELIGDTIGETIVNGATEYEKSLTGYDSSAIEQFCSQVVDCKQKISDVVAEQVEQSQSLASQAACINGYEAYFHGQQPVCLDPSIVVHAAPNSGNYSGAVVVRLTRKQTPESVAALFADKDNYQLFVTATAEDLTNGMNEDLYLPAQLAIPWLEPGQALDVPVPLKLIGNNGMYTQARFFGRTTHMKAQESCYSSGSSWDWVLCLNGGLDTWDFANPVTLEDLISQILGESGNP